MNQPLGTGPGAPDESQNDVGTYRRPVVCWLAKLSPRLSLHASFPSRFALEMLSVHVSFCDSPSNTKAEAGDCSGYKASLTPSLPPYGLGPYRERFWPALTKCNGIVGLLS